MLNITDVLQHRRIYEPCRDIRLTDSQHQRRDSQPYQHRSDRPVAHILEVEVNSTDNTMPPSAAVFTPHVEVHSKSLDLASFIPRIPRADPNEFGAGVSLFYGIYLVAAAMYVGLKTK